MSVDSMTNLLQGLSLDPNYYQDLIEKKKEITKAYYEYIYRSNDHDTPQYLYQLHLKWISYWQKYLGTAYLVIKHPVPTFQTFNDLFTAWYQIGFYYQVESKIILKLYDEILNEIKCLNFHLLNLE